MASTISRRGAGKGRLLTPEAVEQAFIERLKVRFGAWLREGAMRSGSIDRATGTHLVDMPGGEALPTGRAAHLDEISLNGSSAGEPEGDGSALPTQTSAWPLRCPLPGLSEQHVMSNMAEVTTWVQSWHQYERGIPQGVKVHWLTRQWSKLGEQAVTVAVTVASPQELAQWVGMAPRWARACARRDAFIARFESTRPSALWSRHCEMLAEWAEEDILRLQVLLEWFVANPSSNLYLRQLPVPGIDTKWVETRKGVVRDFLLAAHGLSLTTGTQDFHEVCGLRKPPAKLRLRILCLKLRASLGGLCDIEAPVEEVAALPLSVRAAIIVENLETGLALPDFEGAVCFMRLGHAVGELARIPWLGPDRLDAGTLPGTLPQLWYWGDLDTHGFAILARARGILSRLQSVLMDEATFLEGRPLWVTEFTPHRSEELRHLTLAESELYVALRENRWGKNIRLEQERLPWPKCLQTLEEAMTTNCSENRAKSGGPAK